MKKRLLALALTMVPTLVLAQSNIMVSIDVTGLSDPTDYSYTLPEGSNLIEDQFGSFSLLELDIDMRSKYLSAHGALINIEADHSVPVTGTCLFTSAAGVACDLQFRGYHLILSLESNLSGTAEIEPMFGGISGNSHTLVAATVISVK